MAISSVVPRPPLKPIIGNLTELDVDAPVQSLMALAKTYGPFFKLTIFGQDIYVAGSQAIVNELCDEGRFHKAIHPPLAELRSAGGDALFTAHDDEPNWGKAHRLLMPAFGPIGVRGMFDKMLDIAEQMFVRWERFGPNAAIDVADNMTRLTLDTIALCGFDYRFNSFYQNEMHPFVAAMVGTLSEGGRRARRPDMINSLLWSKNRQYEADQAILRDVSRQLIAERRKDPLGAEKDDLLNIMLNGVDPVSGETLSDENIGYQMVTFLVAGHETTSGLLSFATYLLLKNPHVLQKARAVVDDVLGTDTPRVDHLGQLRYIEQILMETLRLWPTAPAFGVRPREDTLLAGQYALSKRDTVMILAPILHRDPAVWEAPDAFRPERFSPENAEKLPPNAWKPFGNGMRACIGRPFAMQEALLVLSMMLQRFDFVLDNPAYALEVHETLTLKPQGLTIRARARGDRSPPVRTNIPRAPQKPLTRPTAQVAPGEKATPLLILYGSNTGSSEAFARRIAGDAPAQGYVPQVAAMDDYAGRLPDQGVVIVVTASYEGQPPDNARQFVAYAESLSPGALTGLRFAVFGCGNRQWARTYQAIPKRVDTALAAAGAEPIKERGEADSGGDFFGAFDAWYATLWQDMSKALGKPAIETGGLVPLAIEFVTSGRENILRLGDLKPGVIVDNSELVDMTAAGARSKRHIEIRLPDGMSYRSGDYLAVLARNPQSNVERALRRFGLAADTHLVVRNGGSASNTLPTDIPVSCGDLLAHYVELSSPATQTQVARLAAVTACPPEKAELLRLCGDAYGVEVLDRRVTMLDLLERFQSAGLEFAEYLAMCPPMRARQYSISSSPLWKPDHVTLTLAVVDRPSLSGQGRHLGIASTYLAKLKPGDRVSVAVRPSNTRFHPPENPATPIIMICAGSGLAPFRGFLQERALQKAAGQAVGPALLFFGIGSPDVDYLYRDQLEAWQQAGVVSVRLACSDMPETGPKTRPEAQYVQHRLWSDRAEVADLFRQGAIVYVCGDGRRMAPAVRETLIDIYRDATHADEEGARKWADRIEHERGRYISDVFA
ncbi:hypothetical protein AEAC466_04785 [Asticcacaulis sp. AC466]|uniref:bifunctional cytochrome P450/NADPH--P450 reductase n=1 Tax=Asticcacaulis sp. AC466 TaxID=1282362 RepID=UPI0003C3FE94|nr:cytochrome P450 [Asticcacaulis sp. AC466]ESQ85025.1 hypothetical protein AEAC466_04785 [Asticcacaulis sp. AC466]